MILTICYLLLYNMSRLEKRKAMEWGNVGYEEEEEDRPEFKGKLTII